MTQASQRTFEQRGTALPSEVVHSAFPRCQADPVGGI